MKRCLIFVVIFFSGQLSAQPGGGGDPGAGEPVPIQGIAFLMIAGGYLVYRSIFKKRDN